MNNLRLIYFIIDSEDELMDKEVRVYEHNKKDLTFLFESNVKWEKCSRTFIRNKLENMGIKEGTYELKEI